MTEQTTFRRFERQRESRLLAHARCYALLLAAVLVLPAVADEPPNIVFILADDLGWSDLGCYGSDWLETPRLDQLATEGLRFTNAYAPAPICSASRAATLTGRTTARNRFEFVTQNEPGRQEFGAPMKTPPLTLNLDLDLRTIPEMLKQANYETAFFGKWHLNQHHKGYLGWSPSHGPTNHGFDTAVEDFGNHPYSYWKDKSKRSFLDLADGDFGDDSMTDRAIEFVKQDHKSPFFLMVSHFYVHDPNHTRLGWLHRHYLEIIPEDHPRRDILAHYGAMVTALDHHVGEVLDAIDLAGLADSTLVVFTSDNGGHPNYAGNDPLRGSKWNLYEGGIRVPMIARWPGEIPAGTTTNSPVIGYDLLPTFAELTDLPTPENIDGRSFATTLRNPDKATEWRPLYWHFPYYHPEGEKFKKAPAAIGIDDGYTSRTQPQSAIREGDWKLIRFHEDERDELYDLSADRAEQNDLSSKNSEKAKELHDRLLNYLGKVDAPIPDSMKFLVTLIIFFCSAVGFTAEQPNVILILADDMAPGDLSSVNGELSSTPRLDALAAESAIFENAYAGSPVCAPSRAALLTGRYPHRTGSVTLNQQKHPELTRIKLDETIVAKRFRANGYATGIVGKWHSGPGEKYEPLRRGFDESVVFHDSTEVTSYFNYQLVHNDEARDYENDGYLTDVLTEHAVDFVRRHRGEPFFLHLAHYAPHRPLSAPDDVVAKYLDKGLDEKIATVYAMIEIMDTGVGVLLDELDSLGIAENTLVIFASDNGPDPLVGDRINTPYRGTKYTINEGGIRVPFFVRWLGTVEPGSRNEVVHFIDVVPSLVEICGLETGPEGLPLDGISFAGLLSDAYSDFAPPPRRFWQWNRLHPRVTHNGAVLENEWKLVKPFVTKNYPKGPSDLDYQLYNLSSDPSEQNDLAADHPEEVERLSQLYRSWFFDIEADRKRDQ